MRKKRCGGGQSKDAMGVETRACFHKRFGGKGEEHRHRLWEMPLSHKEECTRRTRGRGSGGGGMCSAPRPQRGSKVEARNADPKRNETFQRNCTGELKKSAAEVPDWARAVRWKTQSNSYLLLYWGGKGTPRKRGGKGIKTSLKPFQQKTNERHGKRRNKRGEERSGACKGPKGKQERKLSHKPSSIPKSRTD